MIWEIKTLYFQLLNSLGVFWVCRIVLAFFISKRIPQISLSFSRIGSGSLRNHQKEVLCQRMPTIREMKVVAFDIITIIFFIFINFGSLKALSNKCYGNNPTFLRAKFEQVIQIPRAKIEQVIQNLDSIPRAKFEQVIQNLDFLVPQQQDLIVVNLFHLTVLLVNKYFVSMFTIITAIITVIIGRVNIYCSLHPRYQLA